MKRNKRSNSRRPDNRRRGPEECEPNRSKGSPQNDISWYSRYPNLLVGAGQIQYPYRPGMGLNFGTPGAAVLSRGTIAYPANKLLDPIPGIMTLEWVPSIGQSVTDASPASTVCRELYAKVRAAYSSDLDIDAPDLFMYLMSLDSVFLYIAWLKRLYRSVVAASPDNYTIPNLLLRAMGIQNSDIVYLRSNRTELWDGINQLILSVRQFRCPAVFDLFNRHYWMSDNVYMDDQSINSQMYLFNPRYVYGFALLSYTASAPAAGGLELVPLPQYNQGESEPIGPTIVGELLEFGQDLISRIIRWSSAYTINGYLQRAFADTPLFLVEELRMDERLTPVFSPEVLMQIENSHTAHGIRQNSLFGDNVENLHANVTQNPATNVIFCQPYFTSSTPAESPLTGDRMNYPISVRSDAPSVADSVIASRLICTVLRSQCNATTKEITFYYDCGSELPLSWTLWTYSLQDSNGATTRTPTWVDVPSFTTRSNASSLIWVESFDWHPLIVAVDLVGDSPSGVYLFGDIHNGTTVTTEELTSLHRVCMYSELNAFF